jgi:hypothetical protein
MQATWKPHEEHGKLSTEDRKELPDSVYAFPKEKKEPMSDASHVRNAMARFDQVKGVSDEEREQAFINIQAAAKHYGVDMEEKSWRDFWKHPRTKNAAHQS